MLCYCTVVFVGVPVEAQVLPEGRLCSSFFCFCCLGWGGSPASVGVPASAVFQDLAYAGPVGGDPLQGSVG